MRRLIFFVEGAGDAEAVPTLVKRLIKAEGGAHDILLDDAPFVVGSVDSLIKGDYRNWRRFLGVSLKRSNVGGVLLIVDGDHERVGGTTFCVAIMARSLAAAAMDVGAGKLFSVAVVFARQEFETWLIAGAESLAGQRLPDGRRIASDANAPTGDLEESPRDAKGFLRGIVDGGYKPTRDQAAVTKLVDLDQIRARRLRSFRRLESAISVLMQAIRTGQHTVSPAALADL